MAQVTVEIGGRGYKLACGEGEEQHLLDLGRLVDERYARLKSQFGEVGDIRLSVMTAIMMADELSEATQRGDRLEAEVAALRAAREGSGAVVDAAQLQAAAQIEAAAERLERLAQDLAEGVRRD